MGQCQAAVAEAVEVFGKVDILFVCTSEGMFNCSSLHVYMAKNAYGHV